MGAEWTGPGKERSWSLSAHAVTVQTPSRQVPHRDAVRKSGGTHRDPQGSCPPMSETPVACLSSLSHPLSIFLSLRNTFYHKIQDFQRQTSGTILTLTTSSSRTSHHPEDEILFPDGPHAPQPPTTAALLLWGCPFWTFYVNEPA